MASSRSSESTTRSAAETSVSANCGTAIVKRPAAFAAATPGAVELVERLRELGTVRVALASNSSREIVDTALRAADLSDAFEAIVTSDDVEHPKPAPDIYLLACERLEVAPSDAMALEDTAPGIAAAKAAGLYTVAVPQFAETDVSAADRVVDSLERLLTT